jgi:hypothetical protein
VTRSARVPPWSMAARLGLRARTAARAWKLDLELARGADPGSSPELGLRAAQLGSPESRAALARALEAAVRLGHGAPLALTAHVPIRRSAVREHTKALLELAERLREDPVDVQGVAMARVLTSDAGSPLYSSEAPYSLGHAARSAQHALEPVKVPDPAGDRPVRLAPTPAWLKAGSSPTPRRRGS